MSQPLQFLGNLDTFAGAPFIYERPRRRKSRVGPKPGGAATGMNNAHHECWFAHYPLMPERRLNQGLAMIGEQLDRLAETAQGMLADPLELEIGTH